MANPPRDRESRSRTVEQARAEIDAGLTSDKIAGSDPAAAPLGADDEAAGTPVSPDRTPEVGQRAAPAPRDARRRVAAAWLVAAAALALALVGAALLA